MMLEWLGEKDKAAEIEAAVAEVVAEGAVRTYDMGGCATTQEMAQAVCVKVEQPVAPAMAMR
jgi:isocitrate/isopropylmalate dehydrogenase